MTADFRPNAQAMRSAPLADTRQKSWTAWQHVHRTGCLDAACSCRQCVAALSAPRFTPSRLRPQVAARCQHSRWPRRGSTPVLRLRRTGRKRRGLGVPCLRTPAPPNARLRLVRTRIPEKSTLRSRSCSAALLWQLYSRFLTRGHSVVRLAHRSAACTHEACGVLRVAHVFSVLRQRRPTSDVNRT